MPFVPGKPLDHNEPATASEQVQITRTGLLVSARSLDEVKLLVDVGTVWVDLKEPNAGPLGRPTAELVRASQRYLAESKQRRESLCDVRFSVAGGELKEWGSNFGSSSEVVFVEALHPTTYLKIALSSLQKDADWQRKIQEIAANLSDRRQLILVYYADAAEAQCPNWESIIQCANEIGSSYVLVDTWNKEHGNLTSHIDPSQLKSMVVGAKPAGLEVALAGSLTLDSLVQLQSIGAAWLGVRGAVCEDNLRTAFLCKKKLAQAVAVFAQSGKT